MTYSTAKRINRFETNRNGIDAAQRSLQKRIEIEQREDPGFTGTVSVFVKLIDGWVDRHSVRVSRKIEEAELQSGSVDEVCDLLRDRIEIELAELTEFFGSVSIDVCLSNGKIRGHNVIVDNSSKNDVVYF